MAPTHFFDTEVGGSAHGTGKGGLTPFGEKVIRRMEELGVAVDLAHASPATIADVLRIATRPPFISHTGLRAVCDNNRNISDDILREIANRGGLIGIGFWKAATCGTDLAAIVGSIRHAVDVAGVEHVAFGSDFDGAVAVPLDVSQMAHITEALRQAEFTEDEIRAVAGENVYRYFEKVLPPTNSD
jgi:microsomal dipeptidase-like Zn-dependent dipeptidase